MSRLFGRYDAADLQRFFDEAGVFEALRAKGFEHGAVALAEAGLVLPHIRLSAEKDGRRHWLLDACLRRISVASTAPGGEGLDLVLVHWVREEDPTAQFASLRPRLPLQQHPGLGALRRAFRVVVRIAADLAADGVACQPKYFHDAVIFHRSRLFLFLDGAEEGRFEALQRDVAALPLSDASIAVAAWCARDADEQVVRWQPGYQVFPLSPRLTAHFHDPAYAAAVAAALTGSRYRVDTTALAVAQREIAQASG